MSQGELELSHYWRNEAGETLSQKKISVRLSTGRVQVVLLHPLIEKRSNALTMDVRLRNSSSISLTLTYTPPPSQLAMQKKVWHCADRPCEAIFLPRGHRPSPSTGNCLDLLLNRLRPWTTLSRLNRLRRLAVKHLPYLTVHQFGDG